MDKKVITFIVPLVARYTAEQWINRCKSLQKTLYSLSNSATSNFEVVIAGHDKPDISFPNKEHFHFVAVDFDRPDPKKLTPITARADKLKKVDAAWKYATAHWNSQYVMKFDADDFLSSRLVEWLVCNSNSHGFRINLGWIWKDSWKYFLKQENHFDLSCGSSVIIASQFADLPIRINSAKEYAYEGIDINVSNNELSIASYNRTLLVSNNHGNATQQFADHGLHIQEVPFRAGIYRLGSKHSLSRDLHKISSIKMFLSSLLRLRPLTNSLRREYSI
jgi:hypothetical protein